MEFIRILAKSLSPILLKKVAEYIEIQKGELKDKAFEKFYKTSIKNFLRRQKGLNVPNARKYFKHDVTFDGVLAYLYKLTEPDDEIRNHSKDALIRWSEKFAISKDIAFSNNTLVERFLTELENELKKSSNKAWLPHFKDVRTDIANLDKKLDGVLEKLSPPSSETTIPSFLWHVPLKVLASLSTLS